MISVSDVFPLTSGDKKMWVEMGALVEPGYSRRRFWQRWWVEINVTYSTSGLNKEDISDKWVIPHHWPQYDYWTFTLRQALKRTGSVFYKLQDDLNAGDTEDWPWPEQRR